MPRCFSGAICEALCCGSCNVSNDAVLAKFPAGKILSVSTTWDFLELRVIRTDVTLAGELKEIVVRGGIMTTITQNNSV